MLINLGYEDATHREGSPDNALVQWDLSRVVNGHMIVLGKSGVGKTTTLRRLIVQINKADPPPRVHVFDVHGDIHIAEASSVQYSEANPHGLNPLRISPDPHFGGVRKRIQDFLATVNAARSLGSKQESVLRSLLLEVYAAEGFLADDPATWRLPPREQGTARRHPTLDDVHGRATGKLKEFVTGGNTRSVQALDELVRKTRALQNHLLRLRKSGESAADDEKLAKLKGDAISLYADFVGGLDTGDELDEILRYDNCDLLKSVVERLDNLRATGIFRDGRPPFDKDAPVWRYDLAALREAEKRMFVEFRLQELYGVHFAQGPMADPNSLRAVAVLDEAHLFHRADADSIVGTIAREGRKFGIGLILASQSPAHFADDFLANVGTKIVLGLDQMFWDAAVRKMKIGAGMLKDIRPHRTMAVHMSRLGDTRSGFELVRIPRPRAGGREAG